MRKVRIKIYHSWEEADRDDLRESLQMKPEDRVAAVNEIRRKVFRLKGIIADNHVKKIISYDKR